MQIELTQCRSLLAVRPASNGARHTGGNNSSNRGGKSGTAGTRALMRALEGFCLPSFINVCPTWLPQPAHLRTTLEKQFHSRRATHVKHLSGAVDYQSTHYMAPSDTAQHIIVYLLCTHVFRNISLSHKSTLLWSSTHPSRIPNTVALPRNAFVVGIPVALAVLELGGSGIQRQVAASTRKEARGGKASAELPFIGT